MQYICILRFFGKINKNAHEIRRRALISDHRGDDTGEKHTVSEYVIM